MEYFPIVNSRGDTIGKASREECHSGSMQLHPVVHLHVFNSAKKLFLQKRALCKDIQPGKWDSSVGGHVDFGENIEDALRREALEELGISGFEPVFIEKYLFRSRREAELVHTYFTVFDGIITPDPTEISEGRFFSRSEIMERIEKNYFTPNFENEFNSIILQKCNALL
jgi:isopentenyldiphosphate isomerase